jgi:ribosomal protein S18 acetylase RimI-like enzyme
MEFDIRQYHPSDLSMLYQICLKTGDSGKDASKIYIDPDILGHFYAAPYAVLEPDLTFILTHYHAPCGYILGTRDSEKFYEKCESDWFPVLRKRYPLPETNDDSPDARIIHLIHEGHKINQDFISYPAHLHIDILPEGQGKGMGRKLIETFIERLQELKITGLHLQVGKKNTGAIKFYGSVGFHVIKEYKYAIAFGIYL